MNDLDPKSVATTKTIVIHERLPFRFVQKGYIQFNGKPDFRLQEQDYYNRCLLYTSPSPRDGLLSRMPSSA